MSNMAENINNEKTEAERKQIEINTLLSLNVILGDDIVIREICDILDFDYDTVLKELPDTSKSFLDDNGVSLELLKKIISEGA